MRHLHGIGTMVSVLAAIMLLGSNRAYADCIGEPTSACLTGLSVATLSKADRSDPFASDNIDITLKRVVANQLAAGNVDESISTARLIRSPVERSWALHTIAEGAPQGFNLAEIKMAVAELVADLATEARSWQRVTAQSNAIGILVRSGFVDDARPILKQAAEDVAARVRSGAVDDRELNASLVGAAMEVGDVETARAIAEMIPALNERDKSQAMAYLAARVSTRQQDAAPPEISAAQIKDGDLTGVIAEVLAVVNFSRGDVLIDLIKRLEDQGDAQAATAIAENIGKFGIDDNQMIGVGRAFAKKRDAKSALVVFAKIKHPGRATILIDLIRAKAELNDEAGRLIKEAREEVAAEADPVRQVDIHVQLGFALLTIGDREGAAADSTEAAVWLDKIDDPQSRFNEMVQLAALQFMLGDAQNSIATLRQSAIRPEDLVFGQMAVAGVLINYDRPAEAKLAMSEALRAIPPKVSSDALLLGGLYAVAGEMLGQGFGGI